MVVIAEKLKHIVGEQKVHIDEYTLYSFYPYVLLIFLVVLLYE